MGPGKIYFIGLLGAGDLEDDCMATDMFNVLTLIRANPKVSVELFAANRFKDYRCCQGGYYKFGEDSSGRVEGVVPEDDTVIRNGEALKARFLQSVNSATQIMANSDTLLLFLVGHGEEETGGFLVHDTLLSKDELKDVVSENRRIFLWSTASHSEHWLENVPWHAYVTAERTEEPDTITESGPNPPGKSMPLLLPELTTSFLSQFRHISSTKVVRNKTGKKDSARSAMENVPFPWPDDVDLEELLDVASDLLASTGPRLTHCNILKIKLQRTPAHPGTIRALRAAFQHRNISLRQLEKWLVVGWRMEKLPSWNTFYISSAGQNAVREFLDKFPEDARRYTKTLEFLAGEIEPTWLPLHWMEIRAEMALAWEAAGQPTFSFQEFKDVIDNVGDAEMELRVRELKVEKFLQSNLRTWPHLCETLDDLGILATGRQIQSLPASVSTPF